MRAISLPSKTILSASCLKNILSIPQRIRNFIIVTKKLSQRKIPPLAPLNFNAFFRYQERRKISDLFHDFIRQQIDLFMQLFTNLHSSLTIVYFEPEDYSIHSQYLFSNQSKRFEHFRFGFSFHALRGMFPPTLSVA